MKKKNLLRIGIGYVLVGYGCILLVPFFANKFPRKKAALPRHHSWSVPDEHGREYCCYNCGAQRFVEFRFNRIGLPYTVICYEKNGMKSAVDFPCDYHFKRELKNAGLDSDMDTTSRQAIY